MTKNKNITKKFTNTSNKKYFFFLFVANASCTIETSDVPIPHFKPIPILLPIPALRANTNTADTTDTFLSIEHHQ